MPGATPTLLLALLLAGQQVSCLRSSEAATAKQEAPKKRPEQPIPHAPHANDLGRFLAGLPGGPSSPFRDLEQTKAWREHAAASDALWNHVNRRLPQMQAFQQKELASGPTAGETVFYPFGGPDALNVTTLFPRGRSYFLVGLEPPGTLPDRAHLERKDLRWLLPRMRGALDSILRISFFVTREMDRQLRGQITDGLLPVILVQLTRTGNTILGYRAVTLSDEGYIVPREGNDRSQPNPGVEIEFVAEGDTVSKRLCYFSSNLATEKLSQNTRFLAFFDSLNPDVTFFKATSYMPHYEMFSLFRERVLFGTSAVVQDDSGIPFRYFAAPNWQVQLYGHYEKPIRLFHWLKQPDLTAAFQQPGVKTIDFQIGYGFGRAPTNLLVARKSNPQTTIAGNVAVDRTAAR